MQTLHNLVFYAIFFVFLCYAPPNSFGQLELKLQNMPEDNTWGVYARPDSTITFIGSPTLTGSGQVTIVGPTGFDFDGSTVESYGGKWVHNARVDHPAEAPDMDYISIGFLQDAPPINFQVNEESLLFTFMVHGDCPDTLYLIDNANDPFTQLPNSEGTNPGNDLSVIGIGSAGFATYSQNYDPCAWSCLYPCDTTNVEIITKAVLVQSPAEAINVYPNPARDQITIVSKEYIAGTFMLIIRNSLGAVIYETKANGYDQFELIIADLDMGMYTLNLKTNGKISRPIKIMVLK